MEKNAALKDMLDGKAMEDMAAVVSRAYPAFPSGRFVSLACEGLDSMELKQRVRHVIGALGETLPKDFTQTAPILRRIPTVWEGASAFGGWALTDYVGVYGLEFPDEAMPTLKTLTPLFSAEFAIRPFIVRYGDRVTAELLEWTADPSEHVRRLVSEGTRPRLPWGMRLKTFVDDPAPIIPLLERLKSDESEYVRRSVANNVNDISKDHPDLVIEICGRWMEGADRNRERLVAHACRTLVKQGHKDVFPLLGFGCGTGLEIAETRWPKEGVVRGERAVFSVRIENRGKERQRAVIDFRLHYRKAGGATAPKVFKMGTANLGPGEAKTLKKTISFADMTTRKHYTGEHAYEPMINGVGGDRFPFELHDPAKK